MSQAAVEDASPGQPPESSLAVATSEAARQRQKIAALEEKLQVLESGHAVKQREINYYMSKGRAIRRIVTLFDSIEDLIGENDRRCDLDSEDENVTLENVCKPGFISLTHALPWLHSRASDLEYDEYSHMLKKVFFTRTNHLPSAESLFSLGRGPIVVEGMTPQSSRAWSPIGSISEFKPNPPVNPDDKYCRGFVNDSCGRLLCPTELDWNNPTVRTGIRDRADGYVVTEMSWPAFLYEQYTADQNDLEKGLFKSTLLLQAFKAIFTSPSSAREVAGDGDADNVIQANRRANKDSHFGKKVKTHVAQIIKMHTVTPRSIAYVSCQLRFALSSVNSWRSIDGDFDYIPFWQNIVDFFERPPGRTAQQNVKRLLAWWTRKVFGTSRRAELSDGRRPECQ
ncbi:uncharacterized protein F5891DRAFT_1184315 [Suillus fuscotomentosus]|uniref:Uncharacterized protein n=1 Tax=Suillus fuscotomentosus TaxID=1912939 RepID=A0AAD4HPF9_9AGAM|nr:uncharacterized protein F5891DRAFT_1184315 [Suillus fuscotomentosus]KAG1904138.1 hypothetical protein F5891DRAFT_1184315 [Suillus fuscotomentosus]